MARHPRPRGYDGRMEIRAPTTELVSLTRDAAAKIKRADGRGAGRRGRGAARRDPGRRLLRASSTRSASTAARRRATTSSSRRRHGRRRPVQRPVPAGRDDRLPRGAPGVGLQDRQPERASVVRLRPLLPGRRRRASAATAPAGAAAAPAARSALLARLGPSRRCASPSSARGPAGFYAAGALLAATCRSRST